MKKPEMPETPKGSKADPHAFEDLVRNLDKREADLSRREAAVVARENQLRIDSAQQRNILATAASRMDAVGSTSFDEAFKDFPLGVSLALSDILEAARRQARTELRSEFDQLAKAQAALADSAGRAADPLVKAVTLRADHLERLLDEALERNRELAANHPGRRSEVDVATLVESIASRTAQLIGARPDGHNG